eukprot:2835970-Amphidinium_carterae.1
MAAWVKVVVSHFECTAPDRWQYLKHLETEEACTGFCYAGSAALWSPGARDPEICAALSLAAIRGFLPVCPVQHSASCETVLG